MKTSTVTVALSFLTGLTLSPAQTSFTKITEGPFVTDLGIDAVCPAWGDLNNDGYVDLVIVGDGDWISADDYRRDVVMVYLNDQHGGFRRATETDIGPAATTTLIGTPITLADYDNDGYLDVYLYEGLEPSPEKVAYLYRGGADGRFTLVSEDVGINRPLGPWTTLGYLFPWGISWVDYDRDGFVDLYLTTAKEFLNEDFDQLWRNKGNGTFSRVLSHVFNAAFDSNFGCWADYDNDGDPDLFLGVTSGSGRFYRNDGSGQFTDVTSSLGLILGWYGAWGDYDNDGHLDLHAQTGLGQNDGAGRFMGITGPTFPGAGEANWIDCDNDGYLDCFTPRCPTTERRVLMRNNRDGTFTELSLGALTSDPASPGGAAWADYDNDGFLDLAVVNRAIDTPNDLYRNDGNGNRWILLRLVGTVSNRSAVGAKVRAQTTIWGQSVQQMREISGTPYTGDLRAHFGLGDATNVTTLRIEWPSGIVQELANVPANQILTITEPARLVPLGPREFQIRCWKGMQFEVEKSYDLRTWDSLGVVTNETGTLIFQDPEGELQTAACFYRVVSR